MPTGSDTTVRIIIPTYNEKENLEPLVQRLLALPINLGVIIVDDNSPDGTGEIADRLAANHNEHVQVLHRSGKLGLGTAYVAGFRQAIADGSDFIVTMDADFSHPPERIPELVAKARNGYDLVIGSRYVPGGRAVECTLPRKILSWGANVFFARTLLNLQARDATAGFRCYRRQVLESLALDQILSNGYSFLIELLYRAQRAGWRVGEMPIVFHNRQQGVSKISRSEIYKALYTVFRLFSERVRTRHR
jgi:dolichol-phosphate mannosyltransferase